MSKNTSISMLRQVGFCRNVANLQSLLTKKALPRESIHDHMKYLLSLAPRTNPSTNIDWFVLSPFLGGEHSAIAKQSNSAFAHRDLKVVWEIYAKKLDENDDLDLVELVGRMSQDLTPVEAICMSPVPLDLPLSVLNDRPSLCGSRIDSFGIPSTNLGGQLSKITISQTSIRPFQCLQVSAISPGRPVRPFNSPGNGTDYSV